MLREPPAKEPLQQGDIILDIPFRFPPKSFNVKVQGISGQARLDSQNQDSVDKVKQLRGEAGSLHTSDIPLVLHSGMIFTQSCDLDNKDDITLARIFPLVAFSREAKDAIAHDEPFILFDIIRRLTEGNDFANLIYLGEMAPHGPQVADLLRLQSFSKDWKDYIHKRRAASLTDEGLKYLQGRLNSFTGRFATLPGFWQTERDQIVAEQTRSNRNAIREAYGRLEEKRKRPTA